MGSINRREFMRGSAAIAAGLSSAAGAAVFQEDSSFRSRWEEIPDRVWPGPETWTNPLQDWRVAGGRLECVNAAHDRNIQLLTRQVGVAPGEFRMSVRLGRLGEGALGKGKGSAGFRLGIQGPLREYRNSLIFGKGLDAGVTSAGLLFVGSGEGATARLEADPESLDLRLEVAPDGGACRVTLAAHDAATGARLAQVVRDKIAPERLAGNLALVANYPSASTGKGKGGDRFWFADWRVSGPGLEVHEDRVFGPILFSHYSLSGGVMKLTAQMPPLGEKDAATVRLEVQREGAWVPVAEEKIHPQARTATFRVEKWDAVADVPYRLLYTLGSRSGSSKEHSWTGVVRRDPVDRPVLTVADVSCNYHQAFPNTLYVGRMASLDPDLLAFVGDQFYESSGGYGIQRAPLEASILDYLRKWYLHGWTWRELTRNRPSLSLPDDHDVYQGNIWGEGGAARHGTQEMGGYDMPGAWVNVVHRTQTSHHPDPVDPAPALQGIAPYYGPLVYGRISFAVLADRMYKSGPEGKVPPTKGRGDHVSDPGFDPKTADLPGLELLGAGQMRFLREWAADWRGAEMKAVISQTIFTAMATTHGGNRERLRADYDANGWPQSPRNAALREIRKAFAFHISGDQHLPAVVHYGIDGPRDAGLAFAGPAVNVGYPRWFEPEKPGLKRRPGAPENTGDFSDHFGHPMTVLAVANGAVQPRKSVLENLHDKASGIGMVRFDKARRKVVVECWPFLADPMKAEAQFPGWPVTIDVLDNYARKPVALLPTLKVSGVPDPVVQVVEEQGGEVVYTLRLSGGSFQPHVFAPGKYTVRVSHPESGKSRTAEGVEAAPDNTQVLDMSL